MPHLIAIPKEKESIGDDVGNSYYPYGTELDVRDDLIDSLGIGGLDVGDTVAIVAMATVTRKSENANAVIGEPVDKSKSISLQLVALDVRAEDTQEDIIKKLYGSK